MTRVYDQKKATFRGISAFVILYRGARVATVAFKNAEACTVYVHWLGTEAIRASAGGGGYDRHSSACAKAAAKSANRGDMTAKSFWSALAIDGGATWDRELERAGFVVLGAL